ncbi:tripartite tricarboxylate transporter substrate binding protein [Ramlibacter sp.]|uniref:Bug family tripartite tricarboxylate transporter substrate binding protein n=1 Tax=Ramlibacter sp. TaxID=1917967 RepID=UPI001852E165|nr:tripartite tricarboxylate transporter substrate binding protein [Ramlibacter sp.]MBA2672749.1 tripartite tricarboxylate transporter substrate binding protein [Ramlibacter sp.]
MLNRRQTLTSIAAIAGLTSVRAQAFPAKPITLLVPFAPGGAADITARLLAKGMTDELGQSLIVENRPGASGLIATEAMLARPADGYTLLLASNAVTTAKWLYPRVSFDVARDLRGVGMATRSPYVAAVSDKFPGNRIADLVRMAKEKPGRIDYATAGSGTGPHLFAEILKQATGTFMTGIPYKGSGPALTALLAGEVQVYFDVLMSSLAQLASGKLKALGVSSRERMAVLPNVATFDEQGIHGLDFSAWFGLVAKAGTPEPVVQQLNAALNKVVQASPFTTRAKELGAAAAGGSPAAFQKTIVDEAVYWGRVIKDRNIRAE